MLFSSPAFVLFFAIYFAFHLTVPPRWRLGLIIVGSTIFYGYWNVYYVWIPHALMLVAYAGTLWVEKARGTPGHRRRVALVIFVLLLPLAGVKYTNFIYNDVLGPLVGVHGRPSNLALPLGISFVTFTMIAYVVDVYRGHYQVERKVSRLAGLILFFPHLIAGPILRPRELLPQLAHTRSARRKLCARIVFGLAIFSVGLLKKLVFADPISESVDAVFNNNVPHSAGAYLLAIYGFAVQIYCDFSGYTDMAIGVAMMIGVRLPRNFLNPYTATSIADFWRRWHISLSRWLRDYLYIPLGGNRGGRVRQAVNVLVTMTLGGLWHGANWTFVVWGVFHGVGIASVHAMGRSAVGGAVAAIPRWIKVLLTFHFVLIGWVLFRAADMATAWRVMSGPFVAPQSTAWAEFAAANVFPLALAAIFFATHRWDNHRTVRRLVSKTPMAVYWPAIVLVWILAITVSSGSSAKFIYFDF
jgi:alginate O-acetyltransferase complex protein AlgI